MQYLTLKTHSWYVETCFGKGAFISWGRSLHFAFFQSLNCLFKQFQILDTRFYYDLSYSYGNNTSFKYSDCNLIYINKIIICQLFITGDIFTYQFPDFSYKISTRHYFKLKLLDYFLK